MQQMLLAGPLQFEKGDRQQGFQTQKQFDTQTDLSLILDQEDHKLLTEVAFGNENTANRGAADI